MKTKKTSIVRIYALSTLISVALLVFVGVEAGLAALFLALVLVALEITFSVDNAVVNTRILEKMSPGWQQAFLTVGIVIAVFGVRVILPLFIVAAASGLGVSTVVDLALNNPDEYGHHLEEAHPIISAFGGTFLFMIFLDFFFQKRKTKWLVHVETVLEKAGKLESLSVILALTALLTITATLDDHVQQQALISGVIGLVTYLVINSFDTLLERANIGKNLQAQTQATFKAGLIGFIYLNIIDASFSLDGVIGAFAITTQVLLIAVGLGIGALYVRVITIHMLRHGVLNKYRFMEHGAHYAIGILAALMLASLKVDVPEVVAGLTGLLFVGTAVVHSYLVLKREQRVVAN